MIFHDFLTKNDENQGKSRKSRENKKKYGFDGLNQSCREFSGDHDPALFRGRKNIKPDRAGRTGTGPDR